MKRRRQSEKGGEMGSFKTRFAADLSAQTLPARCEKTSTLVRDQMSESGRSFAMSDVILICLKPAVPE